MVSLIATGHDRSPRRSVADGERRCRGDRGTSLAAAVVLLFAATAGAIIWLARDVDRTVSNRSIASSIAFQSARGGAQQVAVGSLRDIGADGATVDADAARDEAERIATRLLAEYGVRGRVDAVAVDADTGRVTVTIVIVDPVADVTGVGSARPETG